MSKNSYSDAPNKIEETIINMFDKIMNWETNITKMYMNPFEDQLCTKWYIAPKCYARNLIVLFPLPDIKEDCWREVI